MESRTNTALVNAQNAAQAITDEQTRTAVLALIDAVRLLGDEQTGGHHRIY